MRYLLISWYTVGNPDIPQEKLFFGVLIPTQWKLYWLRMREDLPFIEFLVHPLPGTQEQLQQKLKELADKINNKNHPGPEICLNYRTSTIFSTNTQSRTNCLDFGRVIVPGCNICIFLYFL